MDFHPILDHTPALRTAANQTGFDCLDTEWQGWTASYRFQCRQGHVFIRAIRSLLKSSTLCPVCVQVERTERLHALSRQAGVTCLESQWLGATAQHRFRCPQGHAWRQQGNVVVTGRAACPQCSRARVGVSQYSPDGLERLRQFAVGQGGECLSERYEGVFHVYAFRCAQGHTWFADGKDILYSKTWCTKCSFQRMGEQKRSKDGLARLQAQALLHGGQCLSTAYVGVNGRYAFRCRAGHTWETKGARILRGHWCLICGRGGNRLGLDVARQVARERGGECLSAEYISTDVKMNWLCHRGHTWWTKFSTIRAGHWCPECAWLEQSTKKKTRRKYEAIEAPDAPSAPRRKNHTA